MRPGPRKEPTLVVELGMLKMSIKTDANQNRSVAPLVDLVRVCRTGVFLVKEEWDYT